MGHLRAVAERLGLPLRQFVALMGAHKLARWWRDVQPPYFPQFYASGNPKFDNSYFKCAATLLLLGVPIVTFHSSFSQSPPPALHTAMQFPAA